MKIFQSSKKNLTISERKEITSIFEDLKTASSDNKVKDAISLVKAKIKRLERSDNTYQIALSNITKVLISEVIEDSQSSFYMRRLALISIAYLCDPYDVIPDSHPENGYIDDIYVFHLALTEMEGLNGDCYQRIAAEFGRLQSDS